jgi:hypothetical protein
MHIPIAASCQQQSEVGSYFSCNVTRNAGEVARPPVRSFAIAPQLLRLQRMAGLGKCIAALDTVAEVRCQPFALSAPSKWLIRRVRMADYNISVRQSDYAAEFHQFQYFQRIFIDAVP